jgi:hypothetical protein
MIVSGRYIPAWDHHIPSDTTWPLVVRAVDAIRDLCLRGGECLPERRRRKRSADAYGDAYDEGAGDRDP